MNDRNSTHNGDVQQQKNLVINGDHVLTPADGRSRIAVGKVTRFRLFKGQTV